MQGPHGDLRNGTCVYGHRDLRVEGPVREDLVVCAHLEASPVISVSVTPQQWTCTQGHPGTEKNQSQLDRTKTRTRSTKITIPPYEPDVGWSSRETRASSQPQASASASAKSSVLTNAESCKQCMSIGSFLRFQWPKVRNPKNTDDRLSAIPGNSMP